MVPTPVSRKFEFTADEAKILKACSTPERVQTWLDGLKYNWEKDGKSTLKTFRRIVKEKNAHCLEGAVVAAAMLSQHGYKPLLLCMEARDIDHNLFVYKKNGKWGSIAQSRDPNLRGRAPKFKTLRDLVLAYHPYYWNYWSRDETDLTLRGFALVDLGRFKQDWVTANADPLYIEEYLYSLTYEAIWPREGRTHFISPRKGKLRWVRPPRSATQR